MTLRPANSGRWQLTVARRHRRARPAGPGPGPRSAPVHAGRARPGRAVRRDPARHAAPGRPGLRRDGGGRRGPGRRLRRDALHARRFLTDTPPAMRAAGRGPVGSRRTDVRGRRRRAPGEPDIRAAPDPGARRRPRADQVRRRGGRGGAGPGADHGPGRGHQDVGRRGHRGAAAGDRDPGRGLAGRLPARRGGRGAGVQPAERAHGDGHGAGRRGRDRLRGAPRAAGGPVHAQRGQGGRDRERAGGQGSGHDDGDPPAAGHRPAAPGRRRRRASAGDLSYLARRRRPVCGWPPRAAGGGSAK